MLVFARSVHFLLPPPPLLFAAGVLGDLLYPRCWFAENTNRACNHAASRVQFRPAAWLMPSADAESLGVMVKDLSDAVSEVRTAKCLCCVFPSHLFRCQLTTRFVRCLHLGQIETNPNPWFISLLPLYNTVQTFTAVLGSFSSVWRLLSSESFSLLSVQYAYKRISF